MITNSVRLRAADIFAQHGDTNHALSLNRSVLNFVIVSRKNHKAATLADLRYSQRLMPKAVIPAQR